MLGDSNIVNPAFFAQIEDALLSKGYPMPSLCLLPTWWHDNQNELFVYDASGKLLCTQKKQIPYIYKDETGKMFAEHLVNTKNVIHIIHIPNVGRVAFPICKDLLEEEYIRIMLRQLRATFLLCPSYSSSKTQFDLTAPGSIQYGCYTIWCNTCAAYHKDEIPSHIGLVSGPQGLPEMTEYLLPKCDGDCGSEEEPCVFIAEISMDHTATITTRHYGKE